MEPDVTLREAMLLAAGRDAIASEYATDFAITFEISAPALTAALFVVIIQRGIRAG